jgi:hypothetical protein
MIDLLLGWFVVAVPFLVTVVAAIISLKLPSERHYKKFIGSAVAIGLVFSVLTYWQQVRMVRQAKIDQQSAITATAKETTKNVAASVGKQYDLLVSSLTSQVGELKGQLAAEGKKVDLIGNSNIVTGKTPVHVVVENPSAHPQQPGEPALDVHISEMPATPRPELGQHAMQYILTTNKTMNGGRAIFSCKGTIRAGVAAISGTNMQMGGGGLIDEHTFTSGIASPNWSPDFPLVVTLYYDDTTVDPCKVQLPR